MFINDEHKLCRAFGKLLKTRNTLKLYVLYRLGLTMLAYHITLAPVEAWTRDLSLLRQALYHWATGPLKSQKDSNNVLLLFIAIHDQTIPYNGYFLRLEIFAIRTPKRSILIFAFLIFAIPFNHKKWLIHNYFHTWIWLSSAVIKYF